MGKVIRVFTGFEESDSADTLSRTRMTPQQRVAIFFELQERAHPDALSRDLREFIECLNSNEVEYPVAGTGSLVPFLENGLGYENRQASAIQPIPEPGILAARKPEY